MYIRKIRSAVFTALVVGAAACASEEAVPEVGADILSALDEGTPKAKLLEVMGTGPLVAQFADTLRVERGFRKSLYIVDGKSYEVLFYREKPGNVSETVKANLETPVVLSDAKVLGWGWKYYVEEAMPKYKLPTPLVGDPTKPAVVQ